MKHERLSALMDGELSAQERDEILAEMSRDDALREAWTRYHLLRAVIRREVDEALLISNVAATVAGALQSEPVVLAPRRRMGRYAQLAGSLAIAASVAAVAIFGLQSLQVETTPRLPVAQDAQQERGATRIAGGDHNLNLYLVEHNEFSPSSNLKGMMTYSRVVSYENGR